MSTGNNNQYRENFFGNIDMSSQAPKTNSLSSLGNYAPLLSMVGGGLGALNNPNNPDLGLSALSGVASGAAAGASLGPIGMGVGAGVGGLLSAFQAGKQRKKFQKYQMNMLETYLSQRTQKANIGMLNPMQFKKGGKVLKYNDGGDVDTIIDGLRTIPEYKDYTNDDFKSMLDKLAYIESNRDTTARNPSSSAKGLYQFTDDSYKTAVNRLNNLNEELGLGLDTSGYTTDDITTLDPNKQAVLALVHNHKQARKNNTYLDLNNFEDIYNNYHHTNPDTATVNNFNSKLSSYDSSKSLFRENPLGLVAPPAIPTIPILKLGGSILKYPDGGHQAYEEPIPIQAEKNETIIMPNGMIVDTKASKTHKQMKDDEVTDILPEGAYVMSNDKSKSMMLLKSDLEKIKLPSMPVEYSETSRTSNILSMEKTMADLLPKGKTKITFAGMSKILRDKMPLTELEEDVFAKASNESNLQQRQPYLQLLKQLNDKKAGRPVQAPQQFKKGGAVKKYKEGGLAGSDIEKKFDELKKETVKRIKKLYPNSKVQVVVKGAERSMEAQKEHLKTGASTTNVSLHNFGAARDFNIVIDGKLQHDMKLYQDTLWSAAEDMDLFHLDPNGFGKQDPYHIGLVEERGDGTAFERVFEKYPQILETDLAKKNIEVLRTTGLDKHNKVVDFYDNAVKKQTSSNTTSTKDSTTQSTFRDPLTRSIETTNAGKIPSIKAEANLSTAYSPLEKGEYSISKMGRRTPSDPTKFGTQLEEEVASVEPKDNSPTNMKDKNITLKRDVLGNLYGEDEQGNTYDYKDGEYVSRESNSDIDTTKDVVRDLDTAANESTNISDTAVQDTTVAPSIEQVAIDAIANNDTLRPNQIPRLPGYENTTVAEQEVTNSGQSNREIDTITDEEIINTGVEGPESIESIRARTDKNYDEETAAIESRKTHAPPGSYDSTERYDPNLSIDPPSGPNADLAASNINAGIDSDEQNIRDLEEEMGITKPATETSLKSEFDRVSKIYAGQQEEEEIINESDPVVPTDFTGLDNMYKKANMYNAAGLGASSLFNLLQTRDNLQTPESLLHLQKTQVPLEVGRLAGANTRSTMRDQLNQLGQMSTRPLQNHSAGMFGQGINSMNTLLGNIATQNIDLYNNNISGRQQQENQNNSIRNQNTQQSNAFRNQKLSALGNSMSNYFGTQAQNEMTRPGMEMLLEFYRKNGIMMNNSRTT